MLALAPAHMGIGAFHFSGLAFHHKVHTAENGFQLIIAAFGAFNELMLPVAHPGHDVKLLAALAAQIIKRHV